MNLSTVSHARNDFSFTNLNLSEVRLRPPSMTRISPVVKLESADAKNSSESATSEGWLRSPSGMYF
jgi:hypothetical protein